MDTCFGFYCIKWSEYLSGVYILEKNSQAKDQKPFTNYEDKDLPGKFAGCWRLF
jgi:hypothetical protein